MTVSSSCIGRHSTHVRSVPQLLLEVASPSGACSRCLQSLDVTAVACVVVWTVFNRVRFGAASAADRAGVDIEDGAADLALGVLEHVRRVDGLAFSVVSTEHAYLQHGCTPTSMYGRRPYSLHLKHICLRQVSGCV